MTTALLDGDKRKRGREWYHRNKEAVSASRKKHREENKEMFRVRALAYRLKIYYKLPLEEYSAKLESQRGLCACCYTPFVKAPHVDHNHTTGKVRGLLCAGCNIGVGFYENKANLFREYLEVYDNDNGAN